MPPEVSWPPSSENLRLNGTKSRLVGVQTRKKPRRNCVLKRVSAIAAVRILILYYNSLGTVLDSVANSRSSRPGCGELFSAMLLVAARVAGSDIRGTILSNDEIAGIIALWRRKLIRSVLNISIPYYDGVPSSKRATTYNFTSGMFARRRHILQNNQSLWI